MLAGAESQLISLWPVSDRRTKDLMQAYYTALREGQGRGEALVQVQRRLSASPETAHPFYWASFILSGQRGVMDAAR